MEEDNQSLMELPKVNLEDVFTRLPLQSLLLCCCVSKSLLNLIKNDSDFAKEHFARSDPQLMIHSSENTNFHLIDLDADTTPAFGARVEIKPNFNLPLHSFEVTDSCNGLVLLERMDMVDGSHRCIVCNPVTDSDSDSDSDSSSVYSESDTMGELFIGGSDSWEPLGNLPFSPLTIYSPCYLDKATHWLCIEETVPNLIVFFNFESHQFGEIPTPAHLRKTYINAYWLVALGGFLSIFDPFTMKGKFDIWVMKEYGSWTKDFVIDTTAWGPFHRDLCYKPAICRRNGEVVMICEEGFIILYDLLKKSGRIIKHRPLDFPVRAMVLTPSIMSLRDAMRDSNMTVLNVASRFGQPELNPPFYLELSRTFYE